MYVYVYSKAVQNGKFTGNDAPWLNCLKTVENDDTIKRYEITSFSFETRYLLVQPQNQPNSSTSHCFT